MSNSVRNRFTSVFGDLNIPSSLNFDITNMQSERLLYGPSYRTNTSLGEAAHQEPKGEVQFTNQRDISVQIMQSLVLKQVGFFVRLTVTFII